MFKNKAIKNINKTAYLLDGKLKVLSGHIPTEQDIQAEIARLEAEYKANQYQRLRAKEYPSLQEQADMAYWDRKNGTTTLDDAIEAVKLKYPKGDKV